MKVIVLHGDHTTKLYERLNKFIDVAKKRGWGISDEINRTPSLFNVERLTVVRKYTLLSKKDVPNISKTPGTLVIYNEGTVPQTFIKTLPKDTKVEEFKLPKLIWSFLDNISVKSLHEVIKNEPVEFVFSLLSKRFRDLYWVQASSETLNYQSWQLGKLKRQSERFSKEKIKGIVNKMSEIDVKVKSSKANLTNELDFLLIKSLE